MSGYRPKNKEEDFSYRHYNEILAHLRSTHKPLTFKDAYSLKNDILKTENYILLRHDVEESLFRALDLAEIDHKNDFRSTFFILLTGKYNCFSEHNARNIREIINYGHEIGLHYDVTKLNDSCSLEDQIVQQIKMIEVFFDIDVKSIAPHMPMRNGVVLDIDGYKNTYNDILFRKTLYITDSSQKWRKDAFNKLLKHKGGIQLLIHDNTWSKDSHSIQAISILENIEELQYNIDSSLKYINQYRLGIDMRKVNDK